MKPPATIARTINKACYEQRGCGCCAPDIEDREAARKKAIKAVQGAFERAIQKSIEAERDRVNAAIVKVLTCDYSKAHDLYRQGAETVKNLIEEGMK